MNDISYSKFINGLMKAGVQVNRKMLSEIAIDNKDHFTALVVLAKDALAGKTSKEEVKAPKAKKEVKVEVKDLSKLTVAELREMAKEKGIAGYTSLKKVELVNALN